MGDDSLNRVPGQRWTSRPSVPPDGGFGWFIVLSTFLVFGLTFGVIKSFGVFFVEIHQHFQTTATASSWITSISVATVHFGAPVGSVLSSCLGPRRVVMAGGLLASVGTVAGSLARDLLQLYITVGFLTGLGFALTWTPTVTTLGRYFEKRRPVANALASAGECVLTFVLTPSFQFLVERYSWRGAMLVLGGLQLHLCVCGALLKPLPSAERSSSAKSDALKAKVVRYVDYTLIADSGFVIYSSFGVFAALGFFAPSLFLVPFARSQGMSEYQAAALMSVSAALDLSGRLLFGWVANLRVVETIHQLLATVTLLAIVLLLCPLTSSFTQLALFSAAYGLVFGATVAVHVTVLAEVVGTERLGSALGFFMLIRSSGGLLGPPIAGFFIDQMNDYGAGFLMAGASLLISAVFLLALSQMKRKAARDVKDTPSQNGNAGEDLSNGNSDLGI